MGALTLFFLPIVIGPALVALGVWWLWRTVRAGRARRRNREHGRPAASLGIGVAAVMLILAGLAVTAQALLLLLYAWMHDPPGYEIEPAPDAALEMQQT